MKENESVCKCEDYFVSPPLLLLPNKMRLKQNSKQMREDEKPLKRTGVNLKSAQTKDKRIILSIMNFLKG